ncbi:MAG: YggS family pyridoxal phosphate-dependent enzyme [Acaryochloridaceae cyanobacterium SU_2_1]|nr:YggS family pyridoxal phosphate-dependent enzyme [Acaryochloridaceae cyanobacterium SU_2_1]
MTDSATAIGERITRIRQELPSHVTLIAVSKSMPVEDIRQAYAAGVRDFGESRIQEAITKQANLQDLSDITWHFLGHLQGNKANAALDRFDWIHSVDRLDLAQRLDRLAAARSQSPALCLQVKLWDDPSKFGWSLADLTADLPELLRCQSLNIRGLMTILPMGLTEQQSLEVFQQTKELAGQLEQQTQGAWQLPILSMGMSNDYRLAIQAGATMVRLGRSIFGDLN